MFGDHGANGSNLGTAKWVIFFVLLDSLKKVVDGPKIRHDLKPGNTSKITINGMSQDQKPTILLTHPN